MKLANVCVCVLGLGLLHGCATAGTKLLFHDDFNGQTVSSPPVSPPPGPPANDDLVVGGVEGSALIVGSLRGGGRLRLESGAVPSSIQLAGLAKPHWPQKKSTYFVSYEIAAEQSYAGVLEWRPDLYLTALSFGGKRLGTLVHQSNGQFRVIHGEGTSYMETRYTAGERHLITLSFKMEKERFLVRIEKVDGSAAPEVTSFPFEEKQAETLGEARFAFTIPRPSLEEVMPDVVFLPAFFLIDDVEIRIDKLGQPPVET